MLAHMKGCEPKKKQREMQQSNRNTASPSPRLLFSDNKTVWMRHINSQEQLWLFELH